MGISFPMVSIIIPCYNAEKYLSNIMNSVLLQTYKKWETICVNDGSNDNTENILLKYAKQDERIKVVSQLNMGVVKAREVGIKEAGGDYLLFVDADDTLVPEALEMLVDRLSVYPHADIVVSGYHIVCQGTVLSTKIPKIDILDSLSYLKRVLVGKTGWELWSKLFRKSLFDEDLTHPQRIRIGEDAAVFIQLVAKSKTIVGYNTPIYNYIQNEESVSQRKSVELAEETLKAAIFIENYLKKTVFYHDLKKEIDAMFLLFYSNSTRRGYLSWNNSLVKKIKKEHFSIVSFYLIPFYKAVYICCWYSLGYLLKYSNIRKH